MGLDARDGLLAAEGWTEQLKLKAVDLDLVFIDMVTYATSATVGAILRGLDVPIVLVALLFMMEAIVARVETRLLRWRA